MTLLRVAQGHPPRLQVTLSLEHTHLSPDYRRYTPKLPRLLGASAAMFSLPGTSALARLCRHLKPLRGPSSSQYGAPAMRRCRLRPP